MIYIAFYWLVYRNLPSQKSVVGWIVGLDQIHGEDQIQPALMELFRDSFTDTEPTKIRGWWS